MTRDGTAETIDAAWFRARLTAGAELDELLAEDPVAELLGMMRSRAPVEMGFGAAPDPGADPAVMQQFTLAVQAAERFKGDASPDLSAEEVEALHAFVQLVARPALRVVGGEVPATNRVWPGLDSARAVVARRLRGVGRIDAADGSPVGTGWLAAPGLLVTNNHVAAALCGVSVHFNPVWRDELEQQYPGHNARWAADPALRPRWDTGASPAPAAAPTGVVRQVRATHPVYDLAVLEVDCVDDTSGLVLPLAAAPPPVDGHKVYVAGYPAVAAAGLHPALETLLFGAAADVCKRVAPGLLRGINAARLVHDATTLGGSSGSAVIDLSTHRVVGLHFSGRYGSANYSVPLWTLKDEAFFADVGIKFG